ncbi:MAG: HD domain-containing phosphohydrolase [Chlorobiaceae bacterium]
MRVGQISADIAREMGWSEEKCNSLQLIGLVHDIGKMSIPSEILSKPGKLSAIEFELVKTHAEQGYQILYDVEFPLPIAEIIREHHERMDGSGYPQGLKGEKILIESRILAVADVLEAMTSHRPYRASLSLEAAIHEIESHREKHFDP